MPTLTRRHLLAGAAATAACAAMPAAVAIEAHGFDLDRFIEVAVAETGRLQPYTVAWTQAVKQAWQLSMGPVGEDFAELYPEEYRILQTEDCSKAHPGMVDLFSEGARNRIPREPADADVLYYDLKSGQQPSSS
jgi:hypothetical protein